MSRICERINLIGNTFAEPVVISVSPDNINWYTYGSGPYGDTPFPTQGYAWSAAQYDANGQRLDEPARPISQNQ